MQTTGEWIFNLGGEVDLSPITIMVTFEINITSELQPADYPSSHDAMEEAEEVVYVLDYLLADRIEYWDEHNDNILWGDDIPNDCIITPVALNKALAWMYEFNGEFRRYVDERIDRHIESTKNDC